MNENRAFFFLFLFLFFPFASGKFSGFSEMASSLSFIYENPKQKLLVTKTPEFEFTKFSLHFLCVVSLVFGVCACVCDDRHRFDPRALNPKKDESKFYLHNLSMPSNTHTILSNEPNEPNCSSQKKELVAYRFPRGRRRHTHTHTHMHAIDVYLIFN